MSLYWKKDAKKVAMLRSCPNVPQMQISVAITEKSVSRFNLTNSADK
jgi:hypothetical protein